MRYDSWNDEEILTQIQAGEKEALDYLMNRYKALVYSKAKALYLIGADKEDLIQEGMIGLYKAILDFKKERKVTFYLFAELCISRQMYSAIKHFNTKKNQPLNESLSIDDALTCCAVNPSPEEALINRETADGMKKRLNTLLSPFEQEVLQLYLKEMNYVRIAKILEKKPKTIDNALQRIKRKMAVCYKMVES